MVKDIEVMRLGFNDLIMKYYTNLIEPKDEHDRLIKEMIWQGFHHGFSYCLDIIEKKIDDKVSENIS